MKNGCIKNIIASTLVSIDCRGSILNVCLVSSFLIAGDSSFIEAGFFSSTSTFPSYSGLILTLSILGHFNASNMEYRISSKVAKDGFDG